MRLSEEIVSQLEDLEKEIRKIQVKKNRIIKDEIDKLGINPQNISFNPSTYEFVSNPKYEIKDGRHGVKVVGDETSKINHGSEEDKDEK